MLASPGKDGSLKLTNEVTLREITRDNLDAILALAVTPEQSKYVASNAKSLAQALFYQDAAWYRAIYAGETPVGFAMLHIDLDEAAYFLWRFMIDHRQQGNGYGRAALQQLIAHVKTLPNATTFELSYVPGPGCPGPFYKKCGFVETGRVQEGEVILELRLTS